MKKEKCCCECGCKEEVRMYFCPRCRSHDVSPIQGWRNAFGLIERWKCRECGFENMIFPIMVVDKKRIEKLNKSKRRKKDD